MKFKKIQKRFWVFILTLTMTFSILPTTIKANTYNDYKLKSFTVNDQGYMSSATISVNINNKDTGSIPLALALTTNAVQNAGSSDAYNLYHPYRTGTVSNNIRDNYSDMDNYIKEGVGGLVKYSKIAAQPAGTVEMTMNDLDAFKINPADNTYHLSIWLAWYSVPKPSEFYWMPDGNRGDKGCALATAASDSGYFAVDVPSSSEYELAPSSGPSGQLVKGPIKDIILKPSEGYVFDGKPSNANGLTYTLNSDSTLLTISGTPTTNIKDIVIPTTKAYKAVNFVGLTANGVANTTNTTELTLTFDKDIEGLTANDININGATKGTLTGPDSSHAYKLSISNITVAEGENVTVQLAKSKFIFTPDKKTVAVHKKAAFIPVVKITGLPLTTKAGKDLNLIGTITPINATNKTIIWSVKNAGATCAVITDNTLKTTSDGTVKLIATILNGKSETEDYTQEFNITVTKSDEKILNENIVTTENVLNDIIAKNETTETEIIEKVGNSLTGGVSAVWKEGHPTKKNATEDTEGSIKGIIVLTLNGVSKEVIVDLPIAKLPHKHQPVKEWLSDASHHWHNCIANDGEKIAVDAHIPGEAATIYHGQVCIVCGYEMMPKLPSKVAIVDETSKMKIENADGTSFDAAIELIITKKSTEEIKKYQGALDKEAKGMSIAGLYDIQLLKNGVEVLPSGKLKITLTPTDEMKAMTNWQVVNINEIGDIIVIPSQLIDGKLVFITDNFSNYGIIGKAKITENETPVKPVDTKPNNEPTTDDDSIVKQATPQTGVTSNNTFSLFLLMLSGCTISIVKRKTRKN